MGGTGIGKAWDSLPSLVGKGKARAVPIVFVARKTPYSKNAGGLA